MILSRTMPMLLLVGVLVTPVGCSSDSGSQATDVTGTTGQCTNSDTRFFGEPLAGTNLPGDIVETVVHCPMTQMSDERLSGANETEIRCEYSFQGDQVVADCVSGSVLTNDGGAGVEDAGTSTITGTDIGVQGVVVQEGVRLGTGAYEGLQFSYRMEGTEHTYPWTITGTIESTS